MMTTPDSETAWNESALDGGRIDPSSKLLIISDIHGNWPAMSAVLRAEPDATDILCLGDWVNYGSDPASCVQWGRLHVRPGRALRGNHDVAVLSGKVPRFSRTSRHDLDLILKETVRVLSSEDLAYLSILPASATFRVGAERWWACHALPSNPLEGYLLGGEPVSAWTEEVRLAGNPEVLLLGHTHRQFLKRVGCTLVVNPGSVGRPKDPDGAVSYAIWENGAFHLKKLPGDVQANARMEKAVGNGSHATPA